MSVIPLFIEKWIPAYAGMTRRILRATCMLFVFLCFITITACGDKPLNDPYADDDPAANVYYSSFASSPKTLDPARSYNTDSAVFVGQIYEPPLQYHYLKRPYTLIPLTATQVPVPKFLDAQGNVLSENVPAEQVAQTVYEIEIKPNIYYQPHAAFGENQKRELIADDYVYEIKRLASPKVQSPIFSVMSEYIVGFKEYAENLEKVLSRMHEEKRSGEFLDLRNYEMEGVKVLDRYRYQIVIKGKYTQFMYWLAMAFFAPIPWEVDKFYTDAAKRDKSMTLDWYPVGTGPYQLIENNPNRRMVLAKNPNFHDEFYPSEGEPDDEKNGLLEMAGKKLPFIDKFIFTLEKESIPRWNKFLQGYYDASAIGSDSFDQAIHIDSHGQPQLTDSLLQKNIQLKTSVEASVFYWGFNMFDPIVGGYTESARKLRQAISLALDTEEFIAIFLNGRGIVAQGPISPGIFGYQENNKNFNSYVYVEKNEQVQRKSIEEAKKLLAEAGYLNGRDTKTGQPLVLNYDTPSSNNPDDKAEFDWLRKQFAKLGIQLNIRDTTYNRFQEKMHNGNAQIFFWGWSADYPDPENFLFLFYGPNGEVKNDGENSTNYFNTEYDKLFLQMKNLNNTPEREILIQKMVSIVQYDAPWIFGFYPRAFGLYHQWVYPVKTNEVANNLLKYARINPALRAQKQKEWNQPVLWPLAVLLVLLVLFFIFLARTYWKKEHAKKILENPEKIIGKK